MAFHIKIGNYRFSKNLGVGSFGKVKLAFNEVTGHKVAVKILNKKKIKQQGVFEKVKREIKVLRQFNHPHIIKHYEFIDTPSDIFMVIEFASGGELFDLISRRKRLPEDEARRFFQQIYSSIEYSHAHKITHRDLKPENILLDEYNNIKLIDFGLANSMKDSQALRTACGSPNYAAPEVISGRSYGGVEVDVWSLGVILFAMVCGSSPFDDDCMSSLFQKIKESKYDMPNFISSDVQDLINRMLQPNPVKRITMREIKEHPWYLKELPQYLIELSLMQAKAVEVDREIVKKLFQLNESLRDRSEEEVIKAIKDKKNTDFCGIYELFYHDKLKKECFKVQHQYDEDPLESNPMFISSALSSSSSTAGSTKIKRFKTVKHLMMNSGDDHSQNQKPLSHSQQLGSQEVHQSFSLLSQPHTDRLSRIVRKFRNGDIGSGSSVTSQQRFMKQQNQLIELTRTTATTSKFSVMAGKLIENSGSPSVFGRDAAISQVSTRLETATISPSGVYNGQHTTSVQRQRPGGSNAEQYLNEGSPLFIHRKPVIKPQKWVCGLIFKGTPLELLTLACEVLGQLEIEWQIIPKDLKMKCRSRIDENSVLAYESSLNTEGFDNPLTSSNKDEMIKEFLKKNFLKFYINVYKDVSQDQQNNGSRTSLMGSGGPGGVHLNQGSGALSGGFNKLDDNMGTRYMLDIHLFKGTVCVFTEFVSQFMHLITSSCSICNFNSSCCSSSNQSQMDGGSSRHYAGGHSHNYKLKVFM